MANIYDYEGNVIEITAEVQDNSVTKDKLSAELRAIVCTTPEMYGAVGDGVADDTTALQTALNQGGTVLLNGVYRCTKRINITKSYTTIDGYGTIFGDIAKDDTVLELHARENDIIDHARIKNITITSESQYEHSGICVKHQLSSGVGITDVIIDGIKVIDVSRNGILLAGGSYNTDYIRPFVKVLNCIVKNAGTTGICQSRVSSVIRNNYVVNSGTENLTIDNGCADVTVVGNTFEIVNGGCGNIGCDELERCTITNNIIISKTQSAWNSEYNNAIRCNCNTGDVSELVVCNNVFVNGKYGVVIGNPTSGYVGSGIFANNIFKSVGTSQFYSLNEGNCIKDNNLSM